MGSERDHGKGTTEFQCSLQVKVVLTLPAAEMRSELMVQGPKVQVSKGACGPDSLWGRILEMGKCPWVELVCLGCIEKCLHNFVDIIKWNDAFQVLTWCLTRGMQEPILSIITVIIIVSIFVVCQVTGLLKGTMHTEEHCAEKGVVWLFKPPQLLRKE